MDAKEKFLQYIRTERRLSSETVSTYSGSLKLFGEFLSTLPDPRILETADGDNIRDWMEQLMEKGCSAAYVNKSLAALRTFYKFCLAKEMISVDPAHAITGPKKEKRLPQFLKEAEVNKLLDILKKGDQQLYNVRARTIIYLFYLTGLRASELISLDDSGIDFVSRELKVTGKRNKQRVIPFGDELDDVLKEYIAFRDAKVQRSDDALFVNDKGRRLSYANVRMIVREALSLVSNLKKKSPHVLRHTFATAMLNHDANLESIKKLLGHQSLNTTEVYTHTTFEQLKKVYAEAHPRS